MVCLVFDVIIWFVCYCLLAHYICSFHMHIAFVNWICNLAVAHCICRLKYLVIKTSCQLLILISQLLILLCQLLVLLWLQQWKLQKKMLPWHKCYLPWRLQDLWDRIAYVHQAAHGCITEEEWENILAGYCCLIYIYIVAELASSIYMFYCIWNKLIESS